MPSVCEDEILLLSRKLQPKTCAQGSPASPGTTRTRSNQFSTWSWWADTTTAATHVVLTRYTANEGPNINVWFLFIYSQKWNCAALLFPKQNYNVLSPSSYTHISVRDLYISRIGVPILLQENMWTAISWEYTNPHRHMNVENCRALSRKGIHKWDFHCSVRQSRSQIFLGLN